MTPLSIDELYRKYGPMVLRRARAILGDAQSAQDAMHEIFVRALRSEFRRESSPVTWLYGITTHFCLNVLRDSRRRDELLREQPPAEEAAAGPGPDDRLALARLLLGMPEELRTVAVYYYLDG